MKIVEKRPDIEMFDSIVNRWKEQLIQGQTDTNELVLRLRDFVQTELDRNRIKSNRWIPVEDALPEKDVPVVCYMRSGQILVMELSDDGGWYSGITRYNPRSVTHWMSSPEPPESEGKDGRLD